jgi:hypothetical protein
MTDDHARIPTRRHVVALLGGIPALLWPRASRGVESMAIALGNRSHLCVQPHVRNRLTRFFGDTLGCGAPVTMTVPGIAEPILAFRFTGGGSISVEFSSDALDDQQLRRGAWLELRTDDVDALARRVLDSGVERIRYVATPTFYFVAPGGQVFGIVGNQKP